MVAAHRRRGRRQYELARRALLANATSCTWCGKPISAQLPPGHPLKATADHYIPLANGGANDITNLVPACFLCNCRRQNKGPDWLRPDKNSQVW